MTNGRVVAIFVAPAAEAPLEPRDEVRAVPGRGLEGDRYFDGAGTYSNTPNPNRQVTLIESEALRAAAGDEGITVPPERTRRNILTAGIALNHLVGREFTVGDVRLRGLKLCEPCGHMEGLSGVEGARKALIHRGGLRAEILTEGVLRPGLEIHPAD